MQTVDWYYIMVCSLGILTSIIGSVVLFKRMKRQKRSIVTASISITRKVFLTHFDDNELEVLSLKDVKAILDVSKNRVTKKPQPSIQDSISPEFSTKEPYALNLC